MRHPAQRLGFWCLVVVLLGAAACSSAAPTPADSGTQLPDSGVDFRVSLAAVPGVIVTAETTGVVAGYRLFELTFDQPVDHANPLGAHFTQRLSLLFRDALAPTIVYNSGYRLNPPGRTELTQMVNGNQLSVEHRYFTPSRPAAPVDWTKLNIRQAADDQHALIVALRPLLSGRWLSTGQSKGGMASVFHRRFHPSDVDGTVAYVSPISYAADGQEGPGNRYIQFLDGVGTDPACRASLKTFQVAVLQHRAEMLALLDALGTQLGVSWAQLGRDRALEFAVEETPFLFWQYGNPSDCAQIPVSTATPEELFAFLDGTVSMSAYGDTFLAEFLPYYYQAADELGSPLDDESYLHDTDGGPLLLYPGTDLPAASLPPDVPIPTYDDAAMHDVQGWVSSQGDRLLFVYGQFDPWSAGAIELGQALDSLKLVAPAGNHFSRIATLAPADEATAIDAVSRWSGTAASAPLLRRAGSTDALEPPDPMDVIHPVRRTR